MPESSIGQHLDDVLGSLPTKQDLQAAIEPLATKKEMRESIDKAVAPLATKDELREAISTAVRELVHVINRNTEELRGDLNRIGIPVRTRARGGD